MFWDVFIKLCAINNKKPNQVTKELGLSTATATDWKKGSTPRDVTMHKLADYFGVTVDYLLSKEDKPSASQDANGLSVATRIKERARTRDVAIKTLLEDCELGSNTMSSILHGRAISAYSLARIADYLDCSVDYLLGRTEIPETNHGNVPEPTCQIKITSPAGDVREITVPSKQLKEFVKLLAIQ